MIYCYILSIKLTSVIALANETSSGRIPVDRRLARKFLFIIGLSRTTDLCWVVFVAVVVESVVVDEDWTTTTGTLSCDRLLVETVGIKRWWKRSARVWSGLVLDIEERDGASFVSNDDEVVRNVERDI